MKKTLKKVAPLALFMLIPYLNGNVLKAEKNSQQQYSLVETNVEKNIVLMNKRTEGNIIVRNIIRK